MQRQELTYRWDLALALQVDLVADEYDTVTGHVAAVPQMHQCLLRELEAAHVHDRVYDHVEVWVVRGAEGLDLQQEEICVNRYV